MTSENKLAIGKALIENVLNPMKRAFVGKDEIIDLLGICLVGGENLFMLGPPGTAKSALVNELSRRLHGETFEYLLTRFTEPNEIFGPFDITKLKEGTLETNTEGMLPEASLVFLDELLNANSAILNSLLGVLNERVFRRGRETRKLPVLMCVGASNHLPEDEALQALFDRFLVRVNCVGVADDELGAVINAGWALETVKHEEGVIQISIGDKPSRISAQNGPTNIDIEDVRRLHQCLPDVDVSGIHEAYVELVRRMRKAGIPVSDRRAVKLQRLIAASALLSGRMQAIISDMWVCKYTWDEVEQQEILNTLVDDAIDACMASIGSRHPASTQTHQVNTEQLASDLEALHIQAVQAEVGSVEMAQVRDRLSLLAGNCQWVHDEQQRGFLKEQVDQLWTRVHKAG